MQVKIWFQNRRTKWKKLDNISNAVAAEHKVHSGKGTGGTGNRDKSPSPFPIRKSKGGSAGKQRMKPMPTSGGNSLRIPESLEYSASLDSFEDHSNGSVLTQEGAISESTTSEYGSKASSPPTDELVQYYHSHQHINPPPLLSGAITGTVSSSVANQNHVSQKVSVRNDHSAEPVLAIEKCEPFNLTKATSPKNTAVVAVRECERKELPKGSIVPEFLSTSDPQDFDPKVATTNVQIEEEVETTTEIMKIEKADGSNFNELNKGIGNNDLVSDNVDKMEQS